MDLIKYHARLLREDEKRYAAARIKIFKRIKAAEKKAFSQVRLQEDRDYTEGYIERMRRFVTKFGALAGSHEEWLSCIEKPRDRGQGRYPHRVNNKHMIVRGFSGQVRFNMYREAGEKNSHNDRDIQ